MTYIMSYVRYVMDVLMTGVMTPKTVFDVLCKLYKSLSHLSQRCIWRMSWKYLIKTSRGTFWYFVNWSEAFSWRRVINFICILWMSLCERCFENISHKNVMDVFYTLWMFWWLESDDVLQKDSPGRHLYVCL